MASTLRRDTAAAAPPAGPHALARIGALGDLAHPRQVLGHVTPNWYASIMGTGIVATAAVSLPVQFPGLRAFASVVWAAAALLLAGLTVVTVLHWRQHRQTARGHHLDPVISHSYGAPPMAMLTVGAGTLLLGRDVLGRLGHGRRPHRPWRPARPSVPAAGGHHPAS